MKKPMTGAVALLAGALAVHCQPGIVSFGNYAFLTPYIYVSLGSTLLGGSDTVTTETPEMDVGNGNDWSVALYGNSGSNDAASSLVLLENEGGQPVVTNLETGNLADTDPGTWYSIDIAVVPGNGPTNGYLATVQVRAWYNAGGQYASYEAALSAGAPVGVSVLATMDDEGLGLLPYQLAGGLPELGNIILAYATNASPSGPTLTVRVNSGQLGSLEPNSIVLTWPTTNSGFTLQSTTNAGSPMIWTKVSIAPVVVNCQNTVTNIMSGGQQFFRLANP